MSSNCILNHCQTETHNNTNIIQRTVQELVNVWARQSSLKTSLNKYSVHSTRPAVTSTHTESKSDNRLRTCTSESTSTSHTTTPGTATCERTCSCKPRRQSRHPRHSDLACCHYHQHQVHLSNTCFNINIFLYNILL